jgi:hypothetical protein
MTRILITGGPRTGKTSLSESLADSSGHNNIKHTDDTLTMGLDWSSSSAHVSGWLDEPGPWIVEGVSASRALRKWRDKHPGERPPVDKVIYLHKPYVATTKAQDTMAKGVETVHSELEGWLLDHGIRTEHR